MSTPNRLFYGVLSAAISFALMSSVGCGQKYGIDLRGGGGSESANKDQESVPAGDNPSEERPGEFRPASEIAGDPSDPVSSDRPASCFKIQRVQPQTEVSKSIDLLFVMDTSKSMEDNRAKAAEGLSSFVQQLPGDVDYQVAVMLAHGSLSKWSGKLFEHAGNRVFSSKILSPNVISSRLREMVLSVPADAANEQGEEGLYSLVRAFEKNYGSIHQQGFFRPEAALAVVFVSDENDICAPLTAKQVAAMGPTERKIRLRDCAKGISPKYLLTKMKNARGDLPYFFGAIAHLDRHYSEKDNINDGYGAGYLDVVRTTGGVASEINEPNFSEGLSVMGRFATSKLNLVMDYRLPEASAVEPSSVQVRVDGRLVAFSFDSALGEVHLKDGGKAASLVEIDYCVRAVVD